ncbi:TIGR01777 family oxidoreductase [Aureispira anguillae]|uniref:TIGR01777 family oxidoreductase n=1 Tax=Aureispira anguillae TaxID=2864201 RepID=A0A915YLG5_9BACT|nr:TIGR01777 family oxidoreductase [Aureispira anguillae]BDS15403.1 TIGR01777 family oxidoreductase [Aureispira anguillae]
MKTVLITGGTGLLGKRISFLLEQKGYKIRHLSRSENLGADYPAYQWNPLTQTIDLRAFDDIYGLIHLAGANIAAARWTSKQKKIILESRIQSSQLLVDSLQKIKNKPAVVVGCSAIGYYGNSSTTIPLSENSPQGNDFMSEVCQKWESSIAPIRQLGIRTPIIRVGIVLSTQGGALQQLNKSYPFRLGTYFGNGQQYYSWIHLDDICQIFIKALEDKNMSGTYNGTSPFPATNKTIAHAIAQVYKQKTLILPIPRLVAQLLMGEMSAIVLNNTPVIPQALQELNYSFLFPDLDSALKDIFDRKI